MARAIIEILLWTSVALVAYVYAGYPLTLLLLPARRGEPRGRHAATPRVSVLIAAYNEREHIGETVRNKLELDYPAGLLEVLVVSDGSTDGTDEIVRSIGDPRVRLIRQEPRQGKTMALERARAEAFGEIAVFSDANSHFDRAALRHLAAAFEDEDVGYVTGTLLYRDPGGAPNAASCGAYMRYENWIRRLESRVGSVVGVNGGVDAVRMSLYAPMRADHLPDFVLPLSVVERGFRAVYRPEAVASEEALSRTSDEFRMRVRVSLRGLRTLVEMRRLLSPRFGRFAFQLLVHKVLRYTAFTPLVLAAAANVALAGDPAYSWMLAAQAAFYGTAGLGLIAPRGAIGRLARLPAFFVVTNAAAAIACYRLLRGERVVQWTPRKGT